MRVQGRIVKLWGASDRFVKFEELRIAIAHGAVREVT
jgi:hypothetical protein